MVLRKNHRLVCRFYLPIFKFWRIIQGFPDLILFEKLIYFKILGDPMTRDAYRFIWWPALLLVLEPYCLDNLCVMFEVSNGETHLFEHLRLLWCSLVVLLVSGLVISIGFKRDVGLLSFKGRLQRVNFLERGWFKCFYSLAAVLTVYQLFLGSPECLVNHLI